MSVYSAFEILKKIKTSNATGIDRISSTFMKSTPRYSILIITHLFNSIINTGGYPDCLKTEHIFPLRKKSKDRMLTESNRPISNIICSDIYIEKEM